MAEVVKTLAVIKEAYSPVQELEAFSFLRREELDAL